MDFRGAAHFHGRRGRRGRGRPQHNCQPNRCHSLSPQSRSNDGSFLSGLCSLIVMSSLIAIIYLMLRHHCSTCKAQNDMNNISKSIEDFAQNLSQIQQGYHNLERQIAKFSQELPKLEGQIEILQAFANTIEGGDYGWNPQTHLTLPHVDIYPDKLEHGKSTRIKFSKNLKGNTTQPAEATI